MLGILREKKSEKLFKRMWLFSSPVSHQGSQGEGYKFEVFTNSKCIEPYQDGRIRKF